MSLLPPLLLVGLAAPASAQCAVARLDPADPLTVLARGGALEVAVLLERAKPRVLCQLSIAPRPECPTCHPRGPRLPRAVRRGMESP